MPAGLLVNQQAIRLVYAPRGESSGFLTFRIPEMIQVAGRPLFAALDMLLSADRLFSVEKKEQLPAILAASRKYQNVVSTRLAGQVMAALYELLRGFQAAHDQSSGQLLKDVLARDPNQVYQGLLTVLLRLVFILFAEDRGLLSTDPIYTNHYGIGGLFERLRADAARYPDTMDQRFGAWAQLLTLFRLIYDGGSHGPKFDLPARRGYLFDPSRYAFLEGRQAAEDSIAIPRISDGVLHRVLENLLILDGERLSYRNLDVEQIGSVYEAVMGFTLEVAAGPAIAITSPKKAKGGAPVTINLEELLRAAPAKRAEWLQKATGQKLAPKAAAALKSAASLADLLAALDRKIEKDLTPAVVPAGLNDLPAVARTPPQRIPLYAAVAHQPHCRSRPGSRPPATRPRAHTGTDSRSQDLRSRHGLWRVPGGNLPPVGRASCSKPGAAPIPFRRFRRTRTNCSMPAAS